MVYMCYSVFHFLVYVFKGVNVCVYVGEGLHRSFATPNPFVLTNKICLNQILHKSVKKCSEHSLDNCVQ